MPFDSFSIVHNWTDPLPAPDAARSLFLQTVSALTQESADEEWHWGLSVPFSARNTFRFSINFWWKNSYWSKISILKIQLKEFYHRREITEKHKMKAYPCGHLIGPHCSVQFPLIAMKHVHFLQCGQASSLLRSSAQYFHHQNQIETHHYWWNNSIQGKLLEHEISIEIPLEPIGRIEGGKVVTKIIKSQNYLWMH